ncbi:MAG: SWIB/MDM2 domain-containing protein [Prosthecobacter sp.]|nr:SWIB/MDM2 domain-containing protein [Prosthecobacter sp.]
MATKTAKKAKKAAPAAKAKSKAAPAAKPAAKKAAAPKAKKAAKRKPNPALMKPLQPDAVLSVVVGSKPLARGQIVKKLWEYIKKKGLQDAKNRRNINADDALKAVFNGKKQVSMFEMTKLVSGHIK